MFSDFQQLKNASKNTTLKFIWLELHTECFAKLQKPTFHKFTYW